jgi:hypothetical protein
VGAVFVPDGKRGGAFRVGRRTGYLEVPTNSAWDFGDKPLRSPLWVKLESLPPGAR